MRIVIVSLMLISSAAVKAQTLLPFSFTDYLHGKTIAATADKKWSVTAYSGVSAGYTFFNGGGASVVSAPMGLQLNRRLNENLYAFAGVSLAPAYINFNHSFLTTDPAKGYPANGLFKYNNGLGVYSRAELGLMYVNDAKTFSVSGSIGVQRSSYPVYPYPQANRTKQNSVTRN